MHGHGSSDGVESAGILGRVRVVLVETSHPGNVGAVARAMKTMGLERLYLVRPRRFPSAEATARAAGADDLLHASVVCGSLEAALAGTGFVAAASARRRHLPWPELTPREWAARACAESAASAIAARRALGEWAARACAESAGHEAAIVFGRESWGLSNAELDRAQALVRIPTNPEFRSLNIAAAVQILGYELRLAAEAAADHWRASPAAEAFDPERAPAAAPVTADELEGLFAHLEQALIDIGYLDPKAPKLLMRRLRRLFSRARLERAELNILRGILAAAQKARKGRDS